MITQGKAIYPVLGWNKPANTWYFILALLETGDRFTVNINENSATLKGHIASTGEFIEADLLNDLSNQRHFQKIYDVWSSLTDYVNFNVDQGLKDAGFEQIGIKTYKICGPRQTLVIRQAPLKEIKEEKKFISPVSSLRQVFSDSIEALVADDVGDMHPSIVRELLADINKDIEEAACEAEEKADRVNSFLKKEVFGKIFAKRGMEYGNPWVWSVIYIADYYVGQEWDSSLYQAVKEIHEEYGGNPDWLSSIMEKLEGFAGLSLDEGKRTLNNIAHYQTANRMVQEAYDKLKGTL